MAVPSPSATVIRFLYYLVDVIEIVLGIRFALRLFGANASNAFVGFVYRVSDVFLAPFRTILPTSTIEGAVFEWAVLVAMVLYAIAAYLLVRLLVVVTADERRTTTHEIHE